MSVYLLSHLNDLALEVGYDRLDARNCQDQAMMLAHLAEIDSRKLYLPAGYPSMAAYCLYRKHMAEDTAYKRIAAARAALEFPVVFEYLADGRVHQSGVILLAPHLTVGNVVDLLKAATHQTKKQIKEILADHFPQTESLELVCAFPEAAGTEGQPETSGAQGAVTQTQDGLAQVNELLDPDPVAPSAPPSSVGPIARGRYALQLTVDQDTYALLQRAQELLSHQLPSRDLARVFHLALESLVGTLEKRKFAATSRPVSSARPSNAARTIPAHVRRAVWERDGGQCTFTSEAGQRCCAREQIEFDHIDEVARGGEASVERIRLRCRAHNQYTAERTFGAGFMERKREEARARAEAARVARAAETAAARERAEAARVAKAEAVAAERAAKAEAAAATRAKARAEVEQVDQRNVIPWLLQLGFRIEEARRAAECCEDIAGASLEQRVRAALAYLHRSRSHSAGAMGTARSA